MAKFEVAPEREELDLTHSWQSASERFPWDQVLRSRGYTILSRPKKPGLVTWTRPHEFDQHGQPRVYLECELIAAINKPFIAPYPGEWHPGYAC
jgi:hypothetical protein